MSSPLEHTRTTETCLPFVLHENFGEEGLVKTLPHTSSEVPRGYSVLLLPEPCLWQGERMTRGFAHSGVSLALLSILRMRLGTIPNWRGLKTSSLRPRPCSPCPETAGRWHLREKCLLVKALDGLGKTGFNSWLRNGSYSRCWATTCALVQNLLPHAKLFWDCIC